MKRIAKHPTISLLNSCTTLKEMKQIHAQLVVKGILNNPHFHGQFVASIALNTTNWACICFTSFNVVHGFSRKMVGCFAILVRTSCYFATWSYCNEITLFCLILILVLFLLIAIWRIVLILFLEYIHISFKVEFLDNTWVLFLIKIIFSQIFFYLLTELRLVRILFS